MTETRFWHPFADMHAVRNDEFIIERGDGCWVWDAAGTRYFDATASLWCVNVGHGRPEIADAVQRQMLELASYSAFGHFANRPALELADRLARVAPVDDPRVFLASGGGDAIDGAAKLDWKEFRMGLGETFNALLHRPFEDPARQAEAERRIMIDTSAADSMTKEEAEKSHESQVRQMGQFIRREGRAKELQGNDPAAKSALTVPSSASTIPWQERVIKGRDNPDVAQAVSTKHSPKGHTDREEMRKLLEEITPPTNSIH